MMTKTGVNTTRAEKRGPVVKEGATVSANTHKKILKCAVCSAKLEKSCSSEIACELSSARCPRCGASVS